jgi:hypothetical protein
MDSQLDRYFWESGPQYRQKLEGKIEEVIAEVIVKMGLKEMPLLSCRRRTHPMAKAAVEVYRATVETDQREWPTEKPDVS